MLAEVINELVCSRSAHILKELQPGCVSESNAAVLMAGNTYRQMRG